MLAKHEHRNESLTCAAESRSRRAAAAQVKYVFDEDEGDDLLESGSDFVAGDSDDDM